MDMTKKPTAIICPLSEKMFHVSMSLYGAIFLLSQTCKGIYKLYRKGKYVVHDKAEYICKKRFKLEGNKTIICMKKGEWSKPPHVASIGDPECH